MDSNVVTCILVISFSNMEIFFRKVKIRKKNYLSVDHNDATAVTNNMLFSQSIFAFYQRKSNFHYINYLF